MSGGSPSDTELRGAVQELTGALIELHRAAMNAATTAFEQERGAVGTRLRLLELLMHDPFFAWLRPLSGLMAAIDEGLDDPEPIDHTVAADARAIVEHLLDPPEGAARELADGLAVLLQREADVVLAAGALRKVLARLPRHPPGSHHEAHTRWHARHRPRPHPRRQA